MAIAGLRIRCGSWNSNLKSHLLNNAVRAFKNVIPILLKIRQIEMENVYSTLCFAMNDPLLPWSCSTLFAKKSPEGSLGIHIAAKRIELSSYELFFLVNNIFCLFVCNKGDTIQYLSGLQSRELGQALMLLVFLHLTCPFLLWFCGSPWIFIQIYNFFKLTAARDQTADPWVTSPMLPLYTTGNSLCLF